MNIMHVFTSLLGLAVTFGVLVMVFAHPDQANALIKSGAGAITGVTKALEGRPVQTAS